MFADSRTKSLLLSVFLVALAACGSSGSDSGGGGTTPTNRAPTANAGPTQTVNEFAQVTLDTTLQLYAWHGRHHLAHVKLVADRG